MVWINWQGRNARGARVSAAGELLDTASLALPAHTGASANPVVAFDGTNYFAVWSDLRTGDEDIWGARITPAGQVLDPVGFPIAVASDQQTYPAIAFDGTNYLVVWNDCRNRPNINIYGARVTPAGAVLDTGGIPVSRAGTLQYRPSLAFDGTNYFIAWLDCRSGQGIYGARMSPAGTVLDTAGIAVSVPGGSQDEVSVAYGDSTYLVAWEYYRTGATWDIMGARVNPNGEVLDTSALAISAAAQYQERPAAVFDGANFLVVWDDTRKANSINIYGARVSPSGSILDTAGLEIAAPPNGAMIAAAARGAANSMVVWMDGRSGVDSDIYGARVGRDGTVLDPNGIDITAAANRQEYPALASDGSDYLTVWQDNRSGSSSGWDIYGARVTQSGVALDPAGFAVSAAPADQNYPAAAFDGVNYLVVWDDWQGSSGIEIRGARVTPAGTVLDTAGIVISAGDYDGVNPAVAFDGAEYLVAWEDDRNGYDPDIYGARVTVAGAVLDPNGIPITTAPNQQGSPRIATDGTNSLVVWHDNRRGDLEVYGACDPDRRGAGHRRNPHRDRTQ